MAQSLKLQINTLLTRLGDRDTFSLATAELESIALTLDTTTALPTFLSCILSTDSSDKPALRKHCLKLISLLARTYARSLSPFVPKIISHLLRRLRDPDSAVRSACIDAVSALSSKCSFPSFLKPLCDALFTEQDPNAQIGAALCLSAAIDSTPDPNPDPGRRIMPRLVEKLVKCDGFKAKAAGLTLIGSLIESGGVSPPGSSSIKGLVDCLLGFLTSEDWAARKAAAEALWRLAEVERDSIAEFKTGCLKVFQARKFDKVKAVREVMNQMLEAWKKVPDVSKESSPPPSSQTAVSPKGACHGRYPPGSNGSGVTQIRKKSALVRRSTPPGDCFRNTTRKTSPLGSNEKKRSPVSFQKVNWKKDGKVDVSVPGASSLTRAGDDNTALERRDENMGMSKPGTRRALFGKSFVDKMSKSDRFKTGSLVAPCHRNASENLRGNHEECEDLSLIRSQLAQIEEQQSGLVDLLQKFIGSSQNGMNSLETRVHGLEVALDEISYDLAVTNGRMSNSRRSTCCLLPGADFWNSKVWRKTAARHSSATGTVLAAGVCCRSDLNSDVGKFQLESRRLQLQGRSASRQ